MFNETNLYVEVLSELNLTANQFLLCHLLYDDFLEDTKGTRNKKAISALFKYAAEKHRAWKTEELDDLIEKGFLVNRNPPNKKDPDLLEVTEKFINLVYGTKRRFYEIWEIYPKIIPSFGTAGDYIKLKVCDPEELEEIYNKVVKTNKLHDHVMDILKWAIRNNQINVSIVNFVRSRHWETLEELQKIYKEDNMQIAR